MICYKQQVLLDAVSVASSRYYGATTRLVSLAGKSSPMSFGIAQQDCRECLDDCKRAKSALNNHKTAHGC